MEAPPEGLARPVELADPVPEEELVIGRPPDPVRLDVDVEDSRASGVQRRMETFALRLELAALGLESLEPRQAA